MTLPARLTEVIVSLEAIYAGAVTRGASVEQQSRISHAICAVTDCADALVRLEPHDADAAHVLRAVARDHAAKHLGLIAGATQRRMEASR